LDDSDDVGLPRVGDCGVDVEPIVTVSDVEVAVGIDHWDRQRRWHRRARGVTWATVGGARVA
jgi:hypothetical protein